MDTHANHIKTFKSIFKKNTEDDRGKFSQLQGNVWVYAVGNNQINLSKLMKGGKKLGA